MKRLVVALALAACDRGQPAPAPVSGSSAAPAAAAPAPRLAGCSLTSLPLRRPQPKRLVAIGDLHGDLAATRSALKTAGAIDEADTWIGGDLVIVQTGDVLDRGNDEQAILDLLFALEPQAKAAGGELIMLMGNHELMNAAGDFRYVTRGAQHAFDDRKSLLPGGAYAKKLAQHDVIAIVGDTVFSHAGPTAEFAAQLEAVNLSSRCWLDGQGADLPATLSEDSPVWTRAYGIDTDCAAAKAAADTMGVRRIVVGHTVQETMNSTCDGMVWRIDVGLGSAYGGPIQVLQVYPEPKILTGTR